MRKNGPPYEGEPEGSKRKNAEPIFYSLPADDASPDVAPDVPYGVAQAISSWRRIMIASVDQAKRPNFERASVELLRFANGDALIRHEVVDALSEFAALVDLDLDDAQAIMARSKVAPTDAHPSSSRPANVSRNAGVPALSAKACLEVVCMADVTAKQIDWLWKPRFAIGKVSALAGDGGQGKSTIICDIAARITTGERWPDGADPVLPGNIIILTSEDDPEDTLKPRLLAAGADVTKVFIVQSVRNEDQSRRGFNLQSDLTRLEAEITKLGDVRLVAIDPISSYLGKGVDSHKNAEVRSVLEPLGEMAQRLRVAVLCNNHFSKGAGNANSRIIGSVAFVNHSRSAYIVTPDVEIEDRMLLVPSKTNIGPKQDGLAYRIEGCLIQEGGVEILTSRIAWESTPVTISADQALAAHNETGEDKTAKDFAIEFLTDALAAGPLLVSNVKAKARAAGITEKPLRSAREALGIKPEKAGFDGGWQWRLPKMPSPPEDALQKPKVPPFRERASSAPEGIFGGEAPQDRLDPALRESRNFLRRGGS